MVIKRALNLGCGHQTYPEALNVDRVALPGVDFVFDVDDIPWPPGDESFPEVWASNLFEHVLDPIAFMAEAWRVLQPGGLLHIVTPHWQSENAFTDPTHRRFSTLRSWDYWCHGTDLNRQFGDQYAAGGVFDKESVEQVGEDLMVYLRKRAG